MKKRNILISLVGLLITGCDSSASVNKECFDTVVDNCMAFLKEKYWQSFDYIKKDNNNMYDGYVRITSAKTVECVASISSISRMRSFGKSDMKPSVVTE